MAISLIQYLIRSFADWSVSSAPARHENDPVLPIWEGQILYTFAPSTLVILALVKRCRRIQGRLESTA